MVTCYKSVGGRNEAFFMNTGMEIMDTVAGAPASYLLLCFI